MNDLLNDYLRAVDERLNVPGEQRRAIMRELRLDLDERVADDAKRNPERPIDDVIREVLRDFGNPHEIAAGFSDGKPRMPRARRRALTGVAVFLALNFAVGAGAAVYALYWNAGPSYEGPPGRWEPLTSEDRLLFVGWWRCPHANCTRAPDNVTVTIEYPQTMNLEVQVLLGFSARNGEAVHLRLLDPDGDVVADTWIRDPQSVPVDHRFDFEAADPGAWRLELDYVNFAGKLGVQAWLEPYG